jgi:Brp/Blh family beta-carotene 15,15'-monooxygenase
VVVGSALRAPQPSLEVQVIVLGVLAALLGLPHGALDPLIARRLGLWRSPWGFVRFNALYIAAVVVVVLVWLVLPALSLVLFLLVSAMHFGSDWNMTRPAWLRFMSGFGLLTLPAYSHPDDVSMVYTVLAGPGGATVATAQAWLGPVAVIGLLLAAAVALRRRPHEAVEIVLAGALALVAPPLIFFILYFCALHSFRHLKAGFQAERGGGRRAVLITVVYTVVPILAVAGVLGAVSGGATVSDRVLQVVFIGLAGLTVPHMWLVAREGREQRQATALLPVPTPT